MTSSPTYTDPRDIPLEMWATLADGDFDKASYLKYLIDVTFGIYWQAGDLYTPFLIFQTAADVLEITQATKVTSGLHPVLLFLNPEGEGPTLVWSRNTGFSLETKRAAEGRLIAYPSRSSSMVWMRGTAAGIQLSDLFRLFPRHSPTMLAAVLMTMNSEDGVQLGAVSALLDRRPEPAFRDEADRPVIQYFPSERTNGEPIESRDVTTLVWVPDRFEENGDWLLVAPNRWRELELARDPSRLIYTESAMALSRRLTTNLNYDDDAHRRALEFLRTAATPDGELVEWSEPRPPFRPTHTLVFANETPSRPVAAVGDYNGDFDYLYDENEWQGYPDVDPLYRRHLASGTIWVNGQPQRDPPNVTLRPL